MDKISRRLFLKDSLKLAGLGIVCLPTLTDLASCRTSIGVSPGLPQPSPTLYSHFFGVQTHFGQYRPDLEDLLEIIKQANIKWIRDEVYWSEIEKTKGVFNFPKPYDDYIKAAQARDIQVLLILDYANSLYTPQTNSGLMTDEQRQAFARYCKEVIKRYKPLGVKHYEIWNEPNISMFWHPQPNADDYTSLLKVAYQACKEADPDCIVLGCATSQIDVSFIGRVFALGGGDFMDVVSFHPYYTPNPPEQRLSDGIGKLQSVIGQKPMWVTETGYTTYTGANGVSEEQQANYLVRMFLTARTFPTMHRVSWYDLQNDGTDPAEPEHNFGLIWKDKTPKAAYKAYQTMASLVKDLNLTQQRKNGETYTFTFQKENEWVIVMWKLGQAESTTMPVLADRCRIIERDGESTTVDTPNRSLLLTVSEKPRYIVPAS